jgi:hypothetical protein
MLITKFNAQSPHTQYPDSLLEVLVTEIEKSDYPTYIRPGEFNHGLIAIKISLSGYVRPVSCSGVYQRGDNLPDFLTSLFLLTIKETGCQTKSRTHFGEIFNYHVLTNFQEIARKIFSSDSQECSCLSG